MTESSYFLAIDLGTSRIAAATARVALDGSIITAPFPLGRKSDSVATVVFVGDGGELSFGDAAERRGVTQPERLIREFKRSVGDEVPIVVGGRSLPAEQLYAETVAEIVRIVTEREGAAPEAISLTHPTAWGGHRIDRVRTALSRVGIDDVELITEPEAAARHYEAARPLEMGGTLAVYDLGGGTFDCVVLRKEVDGSFEIIGQPVGIDNLGGADFDDGVLQHVIQSSGLDVATLSVEDPDTRLALSHLRRECVDAKEALSFDSEATIPVLVPPQRTSVRLTRSEFEDMIAPSIQRTVDALDEALESASLDPDQLESILLIGGSSRIPRVAQMLSDSFDRPIAVDADPKAAIALGAARTALVRVHDRDLVPVTAGALAILDATPTDLAVLTPEGELPAPVSQPTLARRSSPFLLAGAAVTIAAAIVFASTVSAGSSNPFRSASSAVTPTPTASPLVPAPVAEAPAAPETEAVVDTSTAPEQSSGNNPRQSAQKRAADAPPQQSATQPTARPTTNAPAANSATPPSTPTNTSPTTAPVDPGPTDPPVDPGPTDPPVDPGPTDPPVDPGPTDPPVDPGPTDPPVDPGPTDPPVDPAPTPEPEPEPVPTEAPAPVPSPSDSPEPI